MALEFGMIGIGGLGFLQAKTYAEMDDVSIIAGADVSPDARSLFDEEFGAPAYEHHLEMLAEHAHELDAVTIVTPHTLHYEQTMACIERGINVLVEKPMVTDVDDAVSLVQAASESDVVLQVGFQRHFHPGFQELRRILTGGRIGDVHGLNCHLGQDWIDTHRGTWRVDPSLSGGGQLYDSGAHLLDALLWVTASTPVSVSAQMVFDTPGVDVNSALSLELEQDGRPVTASVGISGDGYDTTPSEGYVFWGTEGKVEYRGEEIVVSEKGGGIYRTEITDGTDFSSLNRRKLADFIAAIEGSAEPAVPGEVGLQITALTEAAYEAADTGAEVAVQPRIDEAWDRQDR